MQIVLIAAVADNGVIGQGGTMPWRLKSDMRRFVALTAGKPVVMGRKTWLSLAIRPLPRRTNIVVTRDKKEVWSVTRANGGNGSPLTDPYFNIVQRYKGPGADGPPFVTDK